MDLTSDLRQNIGLKVILAVLALAVATLHRAPFKPDQTLSKGGYLAELVLPAVVSVHSRLNYRGKFYNIQNAETDEFFRLSFVILNEAMWDTIEAKTEILVTVVNASPFLGHDFAGLKEELSNTPSLLIDNPDNIGVRDKVYAFGYPSVLTYHPVLSPYAVLLASVTQGVVSRNRLTLLDIPAIRHNAPTTQGNNGGPFLRDETSAKL